MLVTFPVAACTKTSAALWPGIVMVTEKGCIFRVSKLRFLSENNLTPCLEELTTCLVPDSQWCLLKMPTDFRINHYHGCHGCSVQGALRMLAVQALQCITLVSSFNGSLISDTTEKTVLIRNLSMGISLPHFCYFCLVKKKLCSLLAQQSIENLKRTATCFISDLPTSTLNKFSVCWHNVQLLNSFWRVHFPDEMWMNFSDIENALLEVAKNGTLVWTNYAK